MEQYIQTITRHFFRKDDLDQVAREELENFIASYPYSPAGHLLLARKLRDGDRAAFNRQAATTSLYFTNPLWLHWILDASEMDVNGMEPSAASPAQQAENSSPSPLQDEPILDEEATPFLYAPATEPVPAAAITIPSDTETFAEESSLTQSSFFAEENIPEHLSPGSEGLAASSETINEPFTSEGEENQADTVTTNGAFADATSEGFAGSNGSAPASPTNGHFAPPETNNESHNIQSAEPVAVANAATEPFAATTVPAPSETTTGFTEAAEAQEQDEPETDVDDTEPSSDVHIPGPKPDEQTELTIQSYHTIDYFASQGIRLRQEELLKDRFGQQVKSFTEWLRNMKRIGPPPVAAQDESSTEAIREIAAHSLHEKEVITEAMAEVWAKQGNREKAIQVYDKLSLLNPSKSAYFAAKIEQLKHNKL